MKILATGAAGVVGGYLPAEVVKTDIDTLDVRERAQVSSALQEHKPDLVIHLAAATDVDQCELDPDHAYRTNALGTRNVALACAERGITLVYVSTAGVFFGDKADPYHEFDVARPANVYGHSKLAGERYVERFAPKSFVARAGWMIGGGPGREQKFISKMLDRAERTGEISAVADKWGSPTYARHLVRGLLRLAETGAYGTYHFVNRGNCTRYDVAVAVTRRLGVSYRVTPVSSAHFPLPAPRARSEALDTMLLRLNGWDWMPPWEEALEEYLSDEWGDWKPGTRKLVPATR